MPVVNFCMYHKYVYSKVPEQPRLTQRHAKRSRKTTILREDIETSMAADFAMATTTSNTQQQRYNLFFSEEHGTAGISTAKHGNGNSFVSEKTLPVL